MVGFGVSSLAFLQCFRAARGLIDADREAHGEPRPTLAVMDGDDAILEVKIKHANLSGYAEREARNMWATFESVTGTKPLNECTRDDGKSTAVRNSSLTTLSQNLAPSACSIRSPKTSFSPSGLNASAT
jgi:hypothetical protein